MKKVFILVLFLFILFLTLLAAHPTAENEAGQNPPDLIPREVLFGNPVYGSLRLSSDGSSLAYLAPSNKGVMNIWVRPLEKSEA
ncbi:MAG: hypothetical protein EHM45_24645, partial [Desulfobacteraceae bacterium]